jgi:prolyl-tRNA editing enzyme YbaK/EbsC (Cys-tRNA(Pro) deacylase)
MSIEKVKEYFKQYGMENRVLEFDVSSETVILAAAALNCEACRIVKTLSFITDNGPVLIAAAGDARVDNKKFRSRFNTKAKMIPPEDTEIMVGHPVGGVCPFAVNPGVKVYLDVSIKRFKTVYPACGSGNSAIELTVEELEKYSHSAGWVDVCVVNGDE